MSWLLLVVAGIVEIAFSQRIKPTQGFTRLWPTLVVFFLGALSIWLLSLAMKGIPVGTAYAAFTGIGAVGAIALGILVNKDPVTFGRMAALALIVGGVALARVTSPEG